MISVTFRRFSIGLAAVVLAGLASGAADCERRIPDPEPGPLGRWVNPFVGTGGLPWTSGMTYPGPTAPFGMVRPGPDTTGARGLLPGNFATGGYYYGNNFVLGFSHTRLSGTGAQDGAHFRISPKRASGEHARRLNRPTIFDHDGEVASPGFYAVRLEDLDTLVELTATTRVGLHRYTFEGGRERHLLLDATSFMGNNNRAAEGRVRVIPEANEVEGEGRVFTAFAGRYGGLKGYFVARFSRPFSAYGTWSGAELVADRAEVEGDDVGADLQFAAPGGLLRAAPTVVEVKVGLSFVSLENARENLEAEAPEGVGFDAVRARARDAWEEALGRLTVETPDDAIRTNHYTGLYHAMIMPATFTDVDGRYLGFNRTVGEADGFTYVTDLSLWDTFRTEHPLLLFVAPEMQRNSLKSLVRMAREGGRLPRWPSGGGYTGSMFGSPATIVGAESYLKGLTDFEAEEFFEYAKEEANEPGPGGGVDDREGIEDCLMYGYCPDESGRWSVSRTLEFAWADWSLSLLAAALGRPADEALFLERSRAYRNLWNPETGFFHTRKADGSFVEPFYPEWNEYLDELAEILLGVRLADGYAEGSAWQWRWTVPQDPQDLIALFGGAGPFVDALTEFMEGATPERAAVYPGGKYWHGNQHDLHTIFLFDEAGRPDLTQFWTRWALNTRYGTGPDGYDGNDDGGTLGSWYVLAGSLGLYPVAGSDRYWLAAPIVDSATLGVGDAIPFNVVAENQSPANVYVQEASIDGVRLCEPFVRHAQLGPGRTLRFVMGPDPAPGGGFECD